MTDKEIVKAKKLLKKLEEAYNAYYDTSKGMPYDLDTTIRETAICLEHSIDEINRQKAEIEKWKKAQERTKGTLEIVLKNKDDRTIELEKAIKESIEFVKEQGELIEQLKAENDIHVKERAKDIFKFTELASEINLLKMEKSEVIKEFAELVTADYPEMEYYLNVLVKERTEDEGK